jgi:hypothetical protein
MATIVEITVSAQAAIAEVLRSFGISAEHDALYHAGVLTVTLPDTVTEAELTAALTAAEAVAPEPVAPDVAAAITDMRSYVAQQELWYKDRELAFSAFYVGPRYVDLSAYPDTDDYQLVGYGEMQMLMNDSVLWTKTLRECALIRGDITSVIPIQNGDEVDIPAAPFVFDYFYNSTWVSPMNRIVLHYLSTGQTGLKYVTNRYATIAKAVYELDAWLYSRIYRPRSIMRMKLQHDIFRILNATPTPGRSLVEEQERQIADAYRHGAYDPYAIGPPYNREHASDEAMKAAWLDIMGPYDYTLRAIVTQYNADGARTNGVDYMDTWTGFE